MVNKNIKMFASLALILLLSVSFVVADVSGVELRIDNSGNSSANPITGNNGSTISYSVIFDHNRADVGDVLVNFSGNEAFLTVPSEQTFSVGNTTVQGSILMPQSTTSSFRELTANLYLPSDGSFIGTETVRVYYSSTLFTPTPNNPTNDFVCTTVGDLEISDFDLNNLGIGDDETWEPLDEIEIEVEIENTNNDDDVDDVIVELLILDDSGNDVTNDFEVDDEEVDLGRIRDDDQEIAVFRIKELPADVEDGRYNLYIKAYSDGDEEAQCVSESNDFNSNDELSWEFEVEREEDEAVIVKDAIENRIVTQCGAEAVEISFPVVNIGTDEEDHVLVTMFNRDLGVDERIVIDNLNEGRQKEVRFFINIPESLTKTRYDLEINTYYQYDDGDEDDETSYDDNARDDLDRGDSSIVVEVVGCNDADPRVNANLASSARVGENLIVNALVTNDGSESDFDFSVSGTEGWAEVVSISPRSITLDEGDTEEVTITLLPTEAGAFSFDLNMIANGEIFDQRIAVDIEGDSEDSSSGMSLGSENLVYYLAAAIAVLLILIFVTLLVRVSRRSKVSVEEEY